MATEHGNPNFELQKGMPGKREGGRRRARVTCLVSVQQPQSEFSHAIVPLKFLFEHNHSQMDLRTALLSLKP
jgi:hypothetical protein